MTNAKLSPVLLAVAAAAVLFGGEVLRPGERIGLLATSAPPGVGTKSAATDPGDGKDDKSTISLMLRKGVATAPATPVDGDANDIQPEGGDLPNDESQTVVHVPTKMRSDPVPATVNLPPSYKHNPDRQYSVLYLLHGAGSSFKGWPKFADTASLSDRYDIIIVSPDGGKTSWYLDSPIDPRYQYETFVAAELVDYVDANYRTRKDPQRRAIAGFSMGGHGALYLAMRHPDVFGTAVALSGGVDLRPFPSEWDIAKRLGPIATYPERWEEHSVISQVDRQHLTKDIKLHLSLDCGVGDFFLEVNRALHAKLLEKKIKHDYAERPGGHNFEYWKKAISYQMVFIDQHINGDDHDR